MIKSFMFNVMTTYNIISFDFSSYIGKQSLILLIVISSFKVEVKHYSSFMWFNGETNISARSFYKQLSL